MKELSLSALRKSSVPGGNPTRAARKLRLNRFNRANLISIYAATITITITMREILFASFQANQGTNRAFIRSFILTKEEPLICEYVCKCSQIVRAAKRSLSIKTSNQLLHVRIKLGLEASDYVWCAVLW